MMFKYISDVDCVNEEGQTPLHVAMLMDHNDGVEILIKKKADINARDNNGTTTSTTTNNHNMILLLLRQYSNYD